MLSMNKFAHILIAKPVSTFAEYALGHAGAQQVVQMHDADRFFPSVTISAVIFDELRISSTSPASRSPPIVFGFLV